MTREIVRMTRRILQGIPVNDDTIALDVIKAVGPANNYLAQKHTRKIHETGTVYDSVYRSYTERNLGKEGREDDDRSYKSEGHRYPENYEVTPLPDDVKKRIHDIVVEGEEEAEELARFEAKRNSQSFFTDFRLLSENP